MLLSNHFKTRYIRWSMLSAFAIYALAAWIFFVRPGVFTGANYLGWGSDPTGCMWWLSWWPYAITHGLNPFITHSVWAPSGFNLTWDTSAPSLALLAWPLTAIWGSVVSFNVLTLLAPVLAAFAAFVLCREITGKFWPALIGGWLVGFSSYELGQMLGHLSLDFIAGIPFLLWLTVLRYKGKIGFRPYVALAGATLVFQLGVSSEIFATVTFFAVPAFLLSYILCAANRPRLFNIGRDLVLSYLVCVVLASPFLYFFILGRGTAPALLQPQGVYVADLLNYVIPTPVTEIGGTWATFITRHFTGNYSEDGAFLGVFLLAMIGLSVSMLRKNPWVQVLLGMLSVLVICSFGPSLHLMGRPAMNMPWLVIQKLPLIGNVLPVRLTLYIFLVASLLVALWLASLAGGKAVGGYVLAGLAVLSLLPNVHKVTDPWLTPLHIPEFFRTTAYKAVLKPNANVVILPYGYLGDSMLWQDLSDMRFRMAGGYLGFTPPRFAQWPAVQMFYAGPAPGYRKQIAAFCVAHKVQDIIVGPGARKIWVPAINHLRWHRKTTGGVVVYQVPVLPGYKAVTSTEMATLFLLTQFRALKIAASCFLKKGGALATLTPLAAEKMGCLSAAYGGFPAAAPNNNWTKYSGWLGTMNHGIGVGVVVSNKREAKAVIRRFGLSAQTIYFPYPTIWRPSRPLDHSVAGQVLLVFRR